MALMDNQNIGVQANEAYIELNDLQPPINILQSNGHEEEEFDNLLNDISAVVQDPNNLQQLHLQDQGLEPVPQLHHNLQIGWMEFQDNNGADPVFESFTINDHSIGKCNHAANIRLWSQHFEPFKGSSQVIMIPEEWFALFTTLLLSPEHFGWTKQLLQSDALEIIKQQHGTGNLLGYALPQVCPQEQGTLGCLKK